MITETITVAAPQMTATISGVLTGNNFSTLTKDGLGVLALTNATNNFFARVVIAGGTLNIGSDGSLGASFGSRLNRSDVEHVASDLSHAYAAGVLVAMIMIAATAIPASFLSRRPTARMA